MAYNQILAERIQSLLPEDKTKEKKMMGGLAFMVNGKMCVGIIKNDLMVRIDPNIYELALREKGCREMNFTGKPMKGFVFIDSTGTRTEKELKSWIDLALDFNKRAKASKKRGST